VAISQGEVILHYTTPQVQFGTLHDRHRDVSWEYGKGISVLSVAWFEHTHIQKRMKIVKKPFKYQNQDLFCVSII